MTKRIISMILSIAFLITVLPLNVFAAGYITVSMTTGKSSLELGQKTTYSGTAEGTSCTLNTVTFGITYYADEDDYDDGDASDWVYVRNTGLSVSSKTISGTFNTQEGCYVKGTENDGTGSRKLYTDREGIYSISITAYSAGLGTYEIAKKKITVTAPELELDEPEITSPSSSGTFYAGEDVTFKWGSVSDAEGFEWELYETSTSYSNKFITNDVIVGTSSSKRQVTIDGDTFKAGNSYKFKVRAYCDDVESDWGSITITITAYTPKVIPTAEMTVSSTNITLGESLTYTGTGYGNDYKLNTVTLSMAYYANENDYNAGAASNYVYIRNTGLSVSSKTISGTFKTSPGSYVTGTESDGSGSRKLYTDKAGIYTICLTVYSNEHGMAIKAIKKIVVSEPDAPEVLNISVSSNPVLVGEDFTITVKTNSSAYGVALYCDDSSWYIGGVKTKSSSNEYTISYTFEKTNKTDANGYDITNTRKIFAYPLDSNGNEVRDSDSMSYYNITVNPATYTFPDFSVYSATTELDTPVTIKWEAVPSKNGATVYYNLLVNGEVVAEGLTTNSYTLSKNQVNALGVGQYSVMVMATAHQHRQKQSNSGLTITTKPVAIVPGDVNGDGVINGTDVTRLRQYLANNDSTSIPSNGAVTAGADVNEDKKINGKDLSKLLKMLDGKGEIIPKEPEPELPVIPEVKHTYTVKIPLDKADFKATTGRTVYLMPKYGYVKLVAYDETGKEVRLNQAKVTVDLSNSNGIVEFDGFTLKAVKCGYGFISYSQTVNGKEITTEIAIHVGESKLPSSKWKSPYQYAQQEYEYVSKALDLSFTMYQADMPTQYADIDMEAWEIVVSSTADVSDYLKLILQGKIKEADAYLVKDGLAPFIKQYGEQVYSADEVSESTNRAVSFLCCIFEYVPKAIDILNECLGIDEANLIANAWTAFDKGVATERDLEIIVKFASDLANNESLLSKFLGISKISETWEKMKMTPDLFKDAFKNIKNLKNSKMWKSMTKTLTDKKVGVVENKLQTGVKVVNYGVAFIKAIAYGVADYNNSIKVLNAMRNELTHYYGSDDVEIRAINILLDEYENQWCTAFGNLAWNLGIDAIIGKAGCVWAIVDFAANIIKDAAKLDTKKEICMLVFYVCGSGLTVSDIANIFTTGKQTKTLDELDYFAALYFNMILYQNQLALEVASQSDKTKIQAEIDQIKSMFKTYLEYKVPSTSSFN